MRILWNPKDFTWSTYFLLSNNPRFSWLPNTSTFPTSLAGYAKFLMVKGVNRVSLAYWRFRQLDRSTQTTCIFYLYPKTSSITGTHLNLCNPNTTRLTHLFKCLKRIDRLVDDNQVVSGKFRMFSQWGQKISYVRAKNKLC